MVNLINENYEIIDNVSANKKNDITYVLINKDFFTKIIKIPNTNKKNIDNIIEIEVKSMFFNNISVSYTYDILKKEKEIITIIIYFINIDKEKITELNQNYKVQNLYLSQFIYINYLNSLVKEHTYQVILEEYNNIFFILINNKKIVYCNKYNKENIIDDNYLKWLDETIKVYKKSSSDEEYKLTNVCFVNLKDVSQNINNKGILYKVDIVNLNYKLLSKCKSFKLDDSNILNKQLTLIDIVICILLILNIYIGAKYIVLNNQYLKQSKQVISNDSINLKSETKKSNYTILDNTIMIEDNLTKYIEIKSLDYKKDSVVIKGYAKSMDDVCELLDYIEQQLKYLVKNFELPKNINGIYELSLSIGR